MDPIQFLFCRCALPNVDYQPYEDYSDCLPKSAAQLRQAIDANYPYIDSTIKAVYAFANALKTAQASTCTGTGVCLALQRLSPEEFHNYLKAVSFDVSGGQNDF